MSAYTEEQYAAAIPRWCGVPTLEGHIDMMLCWGLCERLREGRLPKPESSCKDCELYSLVHPGTGNANCTPLPDADEPIVVGGGR